MAYGKEADIISLDMRVAIKYACYGNLAELYRRHKADLDMSRATWSLAMRGGAVSEVNRDSIVNLANNLDLFVGENCSWLDKMNAITEFVDLVELFLKKSDILTLQKIRKFLRKNKTFLIS